MSPKHFKGSDPIQISAVESSEADYSDTLISMSLSGWRRVQRADPVWSFWIELKQSRKTVKWKEILSSNYKKHLAFLKSWDSLKLIHGVLHCIVIVPPTWESDHPFLH